MTEVRQSLAMIKYWKTWIHFKDSSGHNNRIYYYYLLFLQNGNLNFESHNRTTGRLPPLQAAANVMSGRVLRVESSGIVGLCSAKGELAVAWNIFITQARKNRSREQPVSVQFDRSCRKLSNCSNTCPNVVSSTYREQGRAQGATTTTWS